MNNVVNSIASEMIKKQQEKIEEVLKHKMSLLSYEAVKQGEHGLAEILRHVNEENLDYCKREIQKMGYSFEMEQPKPNIKHDGNTITSTFNADDIKIRVRKAVFEV